MGCLLVDNLYIFDFEVFAHDWLVVFKEKSTGHKFRFWNDNDGVAAFLESQPLLAGFNNKHYDRYILSAVQLNFTPEQIKWVNDEIIVNGKNGWEIPELRGAPYVDMYDLMDDTQAGTSLKSIEAHLGMDIRETTVAFDIARPLTEEERAEVEFYCDHDVDATDALDDLRQDYLNTKLQLAEEIGLSPRKALSMTNAKLTAAYLKAEPKEHDDEREYVFPPTLKLEYIPDEVLEFFNQIYDLNIPDEVLFKSKLDFEVGGCPCTVGFGGIHGAIPCYRERAGNGRSIRNQDVGSFYPNQMRINGYCSRSIPNPQLYADTIARRIAAKKAGNKAVANALKLVLNTTYGAMLNRYNALFDPLMGRSVCISGQLQLLELAVHLIRDCPTMKIIQLNTDGIMVSLDDSDLAAYWEIVTEWQERTGFELEEDVITEIIQRDVNNYIEIATDGSQKIKGGVLVRGIAPAGAFKVNNNANVVARAVKAYLADGVPIEDTVYGCDNLLDFQIIAKAGGSYAGSFHEVNGHMVAVQKVNRVYATDDWTQGTLYKQNSTTGTLECIANLPANCVVDNDNSLDISVVNKDWYVRETRKQCDRFMGIKPPKRNTRRVNRIKNELLKGLNQ